MNKQLIIISIACFLLKIPHSSAKENDCAQKMEQVQKLLEGTSPFKNPAKILQMVTSCAVSGDRIALNYLGMIYLKGYGVETDHTKAFKSFTKAAHAGNQVAQYNLGRMYKKGLGHTIDFEQAIAWFKKAAAGNNQRAMYELGSMYYKGYGVPQDYDQAVYWFQQSTFPMARHFLGLCYYLGYGVPKDEVKALDIFMHNPIGNSKAMVAYIQEGEHQKAEAAVEQALSQTLVSDSTYVSEDVVKKGSYTSATRTVAVEKLTGEWVGKLVQYDWSGNHIQRILPVAFSLENSKTRDEFIVKAIIDGQETETTAILREGNLYFENLVINLSKLYADKPNESSLVYRLLSTTFKKGGKPENTYLIGSIDAFIESWTEYGEPMAFILKPKSTEDSESDDEQMILSLKSQQDQFIKLYPVPFTDQLTVQYELKATGQVATELISLYGSQKTSLQSGKLLSTGVYTQTYTGMSDLTPGIYVVRVAVDGKAYTRTIIKSN